MGDLDDEECYCNAWSAGECGCGNYPYMEVLRPKWFDTLGANLEAAASMAAMHRIGYTRGFEAGTLLAEFCEDYVPEPYMPIGDTRPTAERLRWAK